MQHTILTERKSFYNTRGKHDSLVNNIQLGVYIVKAGHHMCIFFYVGMCQIKRLMSHGVTGQCYAHNVYFSSTLTSCFDATYISGFVVYWDSILGQMNCSLQYKDMQCSCKSGVLR